jgi:hypothetical protein
MVDKVALGRVSSEHFGFPCQFSFHQLLLDHHLSSGAGTIGQQWPTYQVDLVSPHPEKHCFRLQLRKAEEATDPSCGAGASEYMSECLEDTDPPLGCPT